jgi:hypothetical protein
MKLKMRREPSPEETAAYLDRLHQEKVARELEEHKALVRAKRERDQALIDARQRYEDGIRGEQERATAAEEERRAKRREAELERDRQLIGRYKDCEQRLANVEAALRQLAAHGAPDLSSPEAAMAAAERAVRVLGLKQLLEQADADLRQAEHAIGRHRISG